MTLFRNATREELDGILSWAADEGWNPGIEDATAFWQADPEGFFVAEVQGHIAAAISVVNHTEDFAFLGLYIATPAFRGQGIGHALWKHALQHAGQRVVGLDGVADQQDNYASSGFVMAGGTTRFTGQLPAQVCDRVRFATASDTDVLVDMEGAASAVCKPAYLRAWVQEGDTRKTLVICEGTAITGFCTVRTCGSGAKVGPLLANNKEDALLLLSQAAVEAGSELTVDVPDSAPLLRQLCEEIGMQAGFETARMYRGSSPPAADKAPSYFAVTSLELG